jgi:hypothetical protein
MVVMVIMMVVLVIMVGFEGGLGCLGWYSVAVPLWCVGPKIGPQNHQIIILFGL